jgi:hypothetical protein
MKPASTVFSALLVVAASGGSALADDQEQARAAFQRGIEAFQEEHYQAANEAFRRADELAPSWKLKFNIGQCEAALKRYGLAIEAFEGYLAAGGDEVPPDRRDEVIAELKRLREMVGSLDVSAPSGAVVFVDGVERGRAPLSGVLKVAAGVDHEVRIEREGEVILTQSVKVSGGDTISVRTAPTPGGPAAPPSGAAEVDAGHTGLWPAGWVCLGLGVGLGAVGVGMAGKAKALDDDLQEVCAGGECPPQYHDDVDRQERQSKTAVALLVSGSAVAVTGAVFLIVDAVKTKKRREAQAAVVPTVGPGFAGLAIEGRF